jgi:hypothetical protein
MSLHSAILGRERYGAFLDAQHSLRQFASSSMYVRRDTRSVWPCLDEQAMDVQHDLIVHGRDGGTKGFNKRYSTQMPRLRSSREFGDTRHCSPLLRTIHLHKQDTSDRIRLFNKSDDTIDTRVARGRVSVDSSRTAALKRRTDDQGGPSDPSDIVGGRLDAVLVSTTRADT